MNTDDRYSTCWCFLIVLNEKLYKGEVSFQLREPTVSSDTAFGTITDILAVVFVYRPSPCSCHVISFFGGNICVLTVRMECWQIKQNALLWRKASAAAQQLKGREDSVTLTLPLNVPFCFNQATLTPRCSEYSHNAMCAMPGSSGSNHVFV